jgi:type IV secretion system protein TrbL
MQPGMTLLRPVLLALLGMLVTIEAICMASAILFLQASIPAQLIRFVVRTSVILAVQLVAPAVLTGIVRGFTELGLLAGNNTISIARFMDPGQWISMGFATGAPILEAWNKTGIFSVGEGVIYLFFWIVLIVAFVYMGMSLFVLQLQMGLAVVGAQVLLPTAASRFLSWMARGVIAYPINVAYRFFFKAFLASLVFVILSQRAQAAKQLALSGTMSQQAEAMILALILPVVFAVLFWKSDSIASGLLQGVPGLSTGNFFQAAAGGVALATGGGALAIAGGRIAGAAGGAMLQAGSAAHTAYQMGSATTIASGRMAPLMRMAGGLQGVMTAGGHAARSVVTSRTSPAAQQIRQTLQQGARAGFVHSGGTLPATMTRQIPGPGRLAPGFTANLRQTLQSSAYYFGHDQGHGGIQP